jgi:hypothetical protein
MEDTPHPYSVSAALSDDATAPEGASSNASEWDGFGAYIFQDNGAFISGECISAADRDWLWTYVRAALREMDGRRTNVRAFLDPELQERLETKLRAVLHRVFKPYDIPWWDSAQPLETEEGWADAFYVSRMIPEDYELVEIVPHALTTVRRVGVWLDGDGNEQVRVILAWSPDRHPEPARIHIQYSGRQHFQTFHNSNGTLTRDY